MLKIQRQYIYYHLLGSSRDNTKIDQTGIIMTLTMCASVIRKDSGHWIILVLTYSPVSTHYFRHLVKFSFNC